MRRRLNVDIELGGAHAGQSPPSSLEKPERAQGH